MEILFSEKNQTGIITLNRPKALNALNLDMTIKFYEKLKEWEDNINIKKVLLIGAGNHFCAGGDVKSLFLNGDKNNLKYNFFKTEYRLNYLISQFKKEFLSIWNGVVMGGGVGLSIYGDHRLATDNSKFAMPETAIGFFPDVGASFFLSNLPNNIGKFIGLTGEVLTLNEIIFFGLATDYFPIENLEKVKTSFINNGEMDTKKYEVNSKSLIIENIDIINELFEGNINEIFAKLKNKNTEFENKIYEAFCKKCPMSLAVTEKLINDSKGKTLKECLETEFQLSQKIVYRDDFNNGVNSVLVSKDHNPQWQPSKLSEINIDDLNKYFEIHTEKLYL